METIFDDVFASEQRRGPSEILAWMRSIQEAQTTGVLRLFNPPDDRMILHHYRGKWMTPYPNSVGGAVFESLEDEITKKGDMYLKFIPLSTHGLIHSNLLMRAEYLQQETGLRSIDDVPWALETPDRKTDPYLVKMKWGNAAGSILFNGVSNLPHSLFVSENLVLDEPGISTPILQRKDDLSCTVTLFSPDAALDAWQEIRLRRSFKLLCDRLLERFEAIAGRAIVDSFARMIAVYTASEYLNISILKRQLVNDEFFESSQEAAGHYSKVLNEFLDHFSAVIGPRLLASNLRDVRASFSSDVREILTYYTVLPEEYAV